MAKNLVLQIGVTEDEWDAYLEEVSLERARAKIVQVEVAEEWAVKHHVDDMTIVTTFKGETLSYLMPLSYKERFEYLKEQANLQGKAVPNVTL